MQQIGGRNPDGEHDGMVIDGKKLVFVSILRAGTGILDGLLAVVPGARVGHIGLYRDPKPLVPLSITSRCPASCRSATSSSSIRCLPPATRPSQPWSD